MKEETLSVRKKIEIIRNAFKLYIEWIKEFSEEIGLDQEAIHKILLEDMEK